MDTHDSHTPDGLRDRFRQEKPFIILALAILLIGGLLSHSAYRSAVKAQHELQMEIRAEYQDQLDAIQKTLLELTEERDLLRKTLEENSIPIPDGTE